MLFLITGTPGAGKTLFTLELLYGRDGTKTTDRPIYIDGINTDLPHEVCEGEKWPDLPDGSIVVIDEAQRVFRPRTAHSAVPTFVSELETHRHRGIDIYVITQDAYLIDPHVRRLVGQYWRIERPGGLKYAKAKRWDGVPTMNNKLPEVETKQWVYPKKLFDRYVSTTKDTHKYSVPKKMVFGILFLVVGLSFVGWVVFNLFTGGFTDSDSLNDSPGLGGLPTLESMRANTRRGSSGDSVDALSWRELFTPEIPGKPWTAPVYRETVLDDPVAPLPSACVIKGLDCRCYTDQAVRIAVDRSSCRDFVRNGFHDFTGSDRARSRLRDRSSGSVVDGS